MITTCIFDLDGVIVDTAKFHYSAWKELANKLGFDFSEQDNERLKGVSRIRSLEILLEIGGLKLNEEEKNNLATEKNNRYLELISTLTPEDILPGVSNFLNSIKNNGFKVVLGSASKNAMAILKYVKLDTFFDAVVDGTKVNKAKPDPEVFLQGAHIVKAKVKECVVFEDSQAGIYAAKNAGMYAVGIGEVKNLEGADIVIPGFLKVKPDDILGLFKI